MNIEIANRLVQLRKANNLSQEELAAKLGISRQAVSKWERAEASPDTDNLIGLSKIYNVSLDELLHSDEQYDYDYAVEEASDVPSEKPKEEIYISNEPIPEKKEIREEADGEKIVTERKVWDWVSYPVIIFVLYMILGALFRWWHPTWILFLTIPIYYTMMPMKGKWENDKQMFLAFPFPVFITIIYLLIGFRFGWWHPGWVLYLTIPLYYCWAGSKED